MGFYGNTIYNTYGLQDKSVQPRHLDRNYWRWGRQTAVQSIQMLRKNVLNLPAIGIDGFTQDDWDDCWKEAEKSVFAFHFNSNNKDNTQDYSTELRSLFGAGLNIGWVIKESKGSKSVYCLYFMALGDRNRLAINRPGSIFKLELNPNGYTEDSHLSDYTNYKDSCESNWSNKYLVGPVLSDAHLLPYSVITEKIRDLNVTEPKMADNSISTRTIQNDAVKPSKLDRNYLEKIFLDTTKTYTDLFNKCAKISSKENQDDITNNGSIYICGSLQLPLPTYYTNADDKDTYLENSQGVYDIGRCLLWYYNTTIYVISASRGQIWKIDIVSSPSSDEESQKKYYIEEGKYYLPTLNQTISPMITNRAITPNKLDRDYLEKIYIANIKGYDALFNEDNLKPISSTTTSTETVNKSSSLYFLGNIFLENLPSQYTTSDNGYYISPNNQEASSKDTYRYVLGRSLVWRHSDTTIYIISNTTGYTWKIDKVSRDVSGSQIVDTGNVECKYSITLNTIPGNLIQNNSISTIKIADGAVKTDKLDTEAVTTDKLANEAVTTIKIAKYAITGDKIAEDAITGYNIADTTITKEHILDGEIVGEKIAEHSITPNHLTETYIRGFHALGEPETSTETLIQEGLVRQGDLYINDNTGYVYCFKGYNPSMGRYEWVPVQSGPKSYLEGKRSPRSSRPLQSNIGDIWVDSDTGQTWIYKKFGTEGESRWEELKSYQIENKDIKDRTITASKLAPGTIQSFLLNNTLFTIPVENPEEGLTGMDIGKFLSGNPSEVEHPIIPINYNDNCYLGYKFIRGDVWYNNQLKCIDLNNETVVTIKIKVSGSNKELIGIDVQSDKSFGGVNVDHQPLSPNIGNLNYNSTNGFLEIYLGEDKGWVGIESYSLSHSIAAVEE